MKLPKWLAWMVPRPPLTELLTPRAQQAFALARRVAHQNGDTRYVDSEHLLAGILRLKHAGVLYMLWASGADAAELRTSIDHGTSPTAPAEAPRNTFLPSIKQVLSAAIAEARDMGDEHVGVEHLILGILARGKSSAADALVSRGLTIDRARTIFRILRDPPAGEQSAPVLVMFDIDGTLTESCDLDSATYLDALREVFGFHDVSGDWSAYHDVTDAGILTEVFETRRGQPPTREETRRMREHFVSRLTERVEAAGGIRAMPSAARLLARLVSSPACYAVAYASGGWAATAKLKLKSAGLPIDEVPGAFADDAISREGICRTARQRAEERQGGKFAAVVYIGDGVWDVRTSRQLGYGFVGIGRQENAGKLLSEGAPEVLSDFEDADAFLAAVNRAATLPALSRCAGTTASAR